MFTENFNGFTGSGFTPSPSLGQLDSDLWSITGLSDGKLDFGETKTTGDFARGTSRGGVSIGGIYAFEVETGNSILGVQPAGFDFKPGELILKVPNDSGSRVTNVDLGYVIRFFNDQNRSNSLNFSYSEGGSTYTDISSLDFTTPEAKDSSPVWQSKVRTTEISNLNIAPDKFLYLKWTGNDVSGGGNRDEYGIDDITINLTATNDFNTPPTVAKPISNQTAKVGTAFSFQFAENTFKDINGDQLTYTATLADGSNLPSWLGFNPNNLTFSSISDPTASDVKLLKIKVTANDGRDSVSNNFNLLVADTVVDQDNPGRGTPNNDAIAGGTGKDIIRGGDGDDIIAGNDEADRLHGDGGNDVLDGGSDNDFLEGGTDNDNIEGGTGNDFLLGGTGQDTLTGGDGSDVLMGGDGDDILDGGASGDRLGGFAGNDIFVLTKGDIENTIYDFEDNSDKIGLELSSFTNKSVADVLDNNELTIAQIGADVVLNSGGGPLAIVYNANMSNFTAADFISI